MSDRYLAIENANYIATTMKNLGDEITFKPGGIMETRAHDVLKSAYSLLSRMKEDGLFVSLSKGVFASITRPQDGGKGLDGVVEKDPGYFNPFINLMMGKE